MPIQPRWMVRAEKNLADGYKTRSRGPAVDVENGPLRTCTTCTKLPPLTYVHYGDVRALGTVICNMRFSNIS